MDIVDIVKEDNSELVEALCKEVRDAIRSGNVRCITCNETEIRLLKPILRGLGIPHAEAGPNGLFVADDSGVLTHYIRGI